MDVGLMFDKIFGGFDPGLSEAQRAEQRRQGKSVLDFVVADIGRLSGRLGTDDRTTMERYLEAVRALETRITSSEALVCEPGERPKGFVLSVAGDVEVLVGLKGLVSGAHEKDRCERAIKKVDKDVAGLEKRLNSPAFVEKAPPEVVAEARETLASLQTQKGRLQEALGLAAELDDDDDKKG